MEHARGYVVLTLASCVRFLTLAAQYANECIGRSPTPNSKAVRVEGDVPELMSRFARPAWQLAVPLAVPAGLIGPDPDPDPAWWQMTECDHSDGDRNRKSPILFFFRSFQII